MIDKTQEPDIIKKGDGTYEVRSFTDPSEWYMVDPIKVFCSCRAFEFRGGCKHLEAVNEIIETEEAINSKSTIDKQ